MSRRGLVTRLSRLNNNLIQTEFTLLPLTDLSRARSLILFFVSIRQVAINAEISLPLRNSLFGYVVLKLVFYSGILVDGLLIVIYRGFKDQNWVHWSSQVAWLNIYRFKYVADIWWLLVKNYSWLHLFGHFLICPDQVLFLLKSCRHFSFDCQLWLCNYWVILGSHTILGLRYRLESVCNIFLVILHLLHLILWQMIFLQVGLFHAVQ